MTNELAGMADFHEAGARSSAALTQSLEMAQAAHPNPNDAHVRAGREYAKTVAAGLLDGPTWMPGVAYLLSHPQVAAETARLLAAATIDMFRTDSVADFALIRMHRMHAGVPADPITGPEVDAAMYRDGVEPSNSDPGYTPAHAIGAPMMDTDAVVLALDAANIAYRVAGSAVAHYANAMLDPDSERWFAFESAAHALAVLGNDASSHRRLISDGNDDSYSLSHGMALACLRAEMRELGHYMQSALANGVDGGPAATAYAQNLIDGTTPVPDVTPYDVERLTEVAERDVDSAKNMDRLLVNDWVENHRRALLFRASKVDTIRGAVARLPLPDLHLITFHWLLRTLNEDDADVHGASAYKSGLTFVVHALQGLADRMTGDECEALRFAARLAARRRLSIAAAWLEPEES